MGRRNTAEVNVEVQGSITAHLALGETKLGLGWHQLRLATADYDKIRAPIDIEPFLFLGFRDRVRYSRLIGTQPLMTET